jgi:hypothetical protein
VIARWTHYAWTGSASHSCMRSLKLGCPILLPVSHMPFPASAIIELFVGLIITMELDVIWRWFCAGHVVGHIHFTRSCIMSLTTPYIINQPPFYPIENYFFHINSQCSCPALKLFKSVASTNSTIPLVFFF